MSKKVVAGMVTIAALLVASAASTLDNGVADGARKVEGGARAVGRSVEEIGTKAGKAAGGAARDTGSALESVWDNIVRGLKKAFK